MPRGVVRVRLASLDASRDYYSETAAAWLDIEYRGEVARP
jgi:hypothetical protein